MIVLIIFFSFLKQPQIKLFEFYERKTFIWPKYKIEVTLCFLQQTYSQWRIVFWILACTYTLGGLTFLLFGSGELQPWNNPKSSRKPDMEMQTEKEKEAVPLRRGSS